jgi:hypothetical protein
MRKKFLNLVPFILCIIFQSTFSFAQTTDFETRRQAYLAQGLVNDTNAITVQAFTGNPVNVDELSNLLQGVSTSENVDFNLVKLIRVLFLTNGEHENQILPVINTIPYWLNDGESLRQYWSENHIIMWTSSDWLLHEKYGRPCDDRLYGRLKHFLELKINYGFYEFFSSTYAPYCLTGLLNLADFAQDSTLKSLAGEASKRLLKEILMITNNQGVFYPSAGRNYYGKYDSPWGQNHSHLIYLLTGMGPLPTGVSHSGGFLSTSTLNIDEVTQSWTSNLDIILPVGHTLQEGVAINSVLSDADRVIFQWSSGAYFHPDVAVETATLINDSSLWNHTEFQPFAQFQTLPVDQAPFLANIASSISKSSVICGQDVAIFKHGSITLSSVQDFWKGKQGYQVMPCVATIGTSAVLTASGKVEPVWSDRADRISNNDLPYVEQKHNVALLMYRPETIGLAAFNDTNPEVSVRWPSAEFDEERQDSLWLIGRQGNSYVAVRRSCLGETFGIPTCYNPDGQTWVIVVGDSGMYGSFDNFEELVQQSTVTENWILDQTDTQWVYSGFVNFDTISIGYDWRSPYGPSLGIEGKDLKGNWGIYPNPGSDRLLVEIGNPTGVNDLEVFDTYGRLVYSKRIDGGENRIEIATATWADATYFIKIKGHLESEIKRWVKIGK